MRGQSPAWIHDEEPRGISTRLAFDRTRLAHDRTMMAWIRTATSLLTFGVALYTFFFHLREQQTTKTSESFFGARTLGLVMIGFGVFSLALAVWQHQHEMKRLRADYPEAPRSLSLFLAALMALLGIIGFFAALFRQ